MNLRKTFLLSILVLLLGLASSSLADLVAHWPMNEGSGNTAADVVGGHDGTLKGGVAWAGEGSPMNGSALFFDGAQSGQHGTDPGNVNWVDAGTFDVTGGTGLTLAAWIKPESFGIGDARVINKGTSWSSADILWMLSTIGDGTGLRMRLKTDDGGPDAGTTTLMSDNGFLEADTWQHVAGTYDGGMMRLWLWKPGDALHTEIVSTAKTGVIAVDPTVTVGIGNLGPGLPGGLSKTFHGTIDDLRIYNTALSQEEMVALVPEPATIALLGLGGLSLLRRKK
jgi:hypothetical protein